MEKSTDTQIYYRVEKASKERMDWMFDNYWRDNEERQKKRDVYFGFVAIDESENIIGYLIAEEKTVPPPLNVTDWFIVNIRVNSDLRRQGIATAILKKATECAEQAGVQNFFGWCLSNPSSPMFWLNQNYSFTSSITKRIDGSSAISNRFFSRIVKPKDKASVMPEGISINDEVKLSSIYNEYILTECNDYVHQRKDEIFALTAVGESGETLGFVTALATEMYEPLNAIQWYIPYIYVRPESRGRGIARALINALIERAQKSDVIQLSCVRKGEEIGGFWYNIGFDIFRLRHIYKSPDDGIYPIVAGKRIPPTNQ